MDLVERLRCRAIGRDRELMEDAVYEIERLRAIVRKFPELADGVPVTLGATVYFTHTFHRTWPPVGEVIRGVVTQAWMRAEDEVLFAEIEHAGGSTTILVDELYSTSKAAKAANP